MVGNTSKGISFQLELHTLYADAAGMLLLRNGKFTTGKLNSSLLSYSFVFNRPSCQFLDVSQDMKPT